VAGDLFDGLPRGAQDCCESCIVADSPTGENTRMSTMMIVIIIYNNKDSIGLGNLQIARSVATDGEDAVGGTGDADLDLCPTAVDTEDERRWTGG
jgi:hypothetical protein